MKKKGFAVAGAFSLASGLCGWDGDFFSMCCNFSSYSFSLKKDYSCPTRDSLLIKFNVKCLYSQYCFYQLFFRNCHSFDIPDNDRSRKAVR